MNCRFVEVPLCRHTKTDGRRCKSPALATSAFCHHHQKARRTRPIALSAGPALSTQVLHPLQSRESIQKALAIVVGGLASNQLHPKQAGKMLAALQAASRNLSQT